MPQPHRRDGPVWDPRSHSPIWYFAYGSNMSSRTMCRRNLHPLATAAVTCPSHHLTFDVFGMPFSEPSMASISLLPDHGTKRIRLSTGPSDESIEVPCVAGAAYLLSPQEFRSLIISEGSGIAYRLEKVHLERLHCESKTDRWIEGVAFVAKWPLRPHPLPSARYADLLLEGARELDLPKAYLNFLEEHPRYEGAAQTWLGGSWVFAWIWRPFLGRVVRMKYWWVNEEGNCPRWIAWLVVSLYRLMWWYHDVVHASVFVPGDGGKILESVE
ncbi:hypothetical protein BDZ85DRAFT_285643 [Elsinoe ampelina]|uniref:gamma-glutamylcyclotransferase n=1 Tax=Elsinoe ampelina TaxID=302913 RepID=A0A6A6G0Y2_9PEZI|nr:hypothetical protein BDZ85DRAFT_285643 [Elsinoe ampelina]